MCVKLFILINYLITVDSAQINYIKVPFVVKNNSGIPAILDCNFSVRSDENNFILRWFLNNDEIYHWKPPNPPKALGLLENKIDLEYKATNDPTTTHRAIKILNPTSNMAGTYKCVVSSSVDEDYAAKNMTIIEPESTLVFFYDPPRNSKVNFTCVTSGVYPEPKLHLYESQTDDRQHRSTLEAIEWNTLRHSDGKFSVFTVATADAENLLTGSLFYCDLRIPGTGYVKRKQMLYYPLPLESGVGKCLELSTVAFVLILINQVYLFISSIKI